jgi:hypothetical protein
MTTEIPVTAGLTQSAADLLAAALEDWDNGRSGPAAAGAVIDAARALLAEHEQAQETHAARLAQVAIETGRVLTERGEEIAALTGESQRREAALRDLCADGEPMRLAEDDPPDTAPVVCVAVVDVLRVLDGGERP